jgi:hypothetical protein
MQWIKYDEFKFLQDWTNYMQYLPIMLQNGTISLETCIKLIENYGKNKKD